MDRRLRFRLAPRPANSLAVDGDDVHRRFRQPRNPIDEAALKSLGVERGENVAQSVVRRRAVGEGQKSAQQVQFLLSEPRDRREAVRPGKHAKQRQKQNLIQGIDDFPRLPSVRQIAEMTKKTRSLRNRSKIRPTHRAPPESPGHDRFSYSTLCHQVLHPITLTFQATNLAGGGILLYRFKNNWSGQFKGQTKWEDNMVFKRIVAPLAVALFVGSA